MQKWQHCKLQGSKVSFLGAAGLFENRGDQHVGERAAWSKLEDEGWELVGVIYVPEEGPVFYFKRPAPLPEKA